MILRWFRDEFGDGCDYAALVEPAAVIPAGSEGLILLPHFSGMNSPAVNPEAKGVFYGITTAHRKAHFVRAVLESVAYALRDNVQLLVDLGIPCRDVTSLGGAARSNLWLQIKADILQRNITVMHCEEATSLGTAILAAVGTGAFPDIRCAVKAMVRTTVTIAANPSNQDVYEGAFQKYRDLNQRLF
jgi:xylulokinase